jgi:PQQ-like domain
MPLCRRFVTRLILTSFSISCCFAGGASLAFSQDVLTYHNNGARTGLNSAETILTPSNVNPASFGKLFTLTVDGRVDAEPLYLSAVPIPGSGTHNLLIVATEHGSVYAFDADTGSLIWRITTLKSGETASDDRGCSQVTPEIGITSTPAIQRPTGSNGVIYVVAMSKDSSGDYHQRLHALNAPTGSERAKSPVEITAKFPGTGDNSSGGDVIFDPAQYKERSGLLITGGMVYLAWSSHCDIRPYTGWIMGYNPTSLVQETVINITPNGNEGAIWGSGGGLTSDNAGNIFFLDANGTFDTTLNSSGFPSSGDYGNAFIRLSATSSSLTVADYFEMDNGVQESDGDTDLGSGGAILLSGVKDASGNTWKLAAGAGKDGNLYLVDRTNMGKFNSGSNKIYQEISGALPGGIWSSPAYSGNKLYFGPVGQPILAFQFKNAKLLPTPLQTSNTFPYPGATPSISSNNGEDAIVWAAANASPAVLYAYNAVNLQELYNSNQAADSRDHFGFGNKFITPMIANGKVYVGTTTGVGVFGLLPK